MKILDKIECMLALAKKPLTAEEIVVMLSVFDFWEGTGKTPDASIASFIYVDIKENGNNSRFIKTEPAKFTLRKG